jgi:ParB/RepB/Spo0J family partition protein
MEQTVLIPIKDIVDNPYQHRDQEDPAAVEELAISIFRNGLQQYPAVRAVNSHYELVYGHTRKAAFRLLSTQGVPTAEIKADKQYAQLPVYVRDLTDRQMFELAIVENLKRRDPKPTEKAKAIQKYMDEFKATSKEAGELFGMNDATARGMVRLLDLPTAVQQKLDDGTITQGTARTLHSMQKLVPDAVVIATLSRIEKSNGASLPEEDIEDVLERQSGVVDMWNEHNRDGKPRSDWRNGWLLDMKNFPNKLLPALTKEEAALPAAQQEHLVNPPACTACPFYSKIRGSHYCGIQACHTRKTSAWNATQIEQASKQLGIAIYTAPEAYRVLSYEHTSLFNKKDKDLRLMAVNGGTRTYQTFFEGVNDNAFCVVATGKAIEKMGTRGGSVNKQQGGKLTEKEKAERRAMKIYRTRRLEMMWACTGVAKSIFEGVPLNVLNKLCEWHSIMIEDRIPEEHSKGNSVADAKADYQRRALVWRLIKDCGSHYQRKAMAAILTDAQKLTGIKAPKALINQAQAWDAEIASAAKPVAVETKKGK